MSSKKKARRSRATFNKPDEHFWAGPIEVARFGKFTLSRWGATLDDWERNQQMSALRLPELCAEIDACVAMIAERVARLPPEQLLHRAWFEFAVKIMEKELQTAPERDEFDELIDRRMIDYIQSVIASTKPAPVIISGEISQEDWTALRDDVTEVFRKLSLEYQLCRAATLRARDPNVDLDLEGLRYSAEVLWINVRGLRQHLHERPALEELLAPHSDILLELFGVDGLEMAEQLEQILYSLTRGHYQAFRRLNQLKDEAMVRVPDLSGPPEGQQTADAFTGLRADPQFIEEFSRLLDQALGMDLFDVQKTSKLPIKLLNELAWSPGEDEEFFAPGEMRGWPFRVWPTMKRPFIRLNGKIYCFDYSMLFDSFYRVLERIIRRLAPEYGDRWNTRQKALSESLPFKYFLQLLPGAKIYQSIRYKVGIQEFECDGIVIYDEHLFIIEVKAGAFTYMAPTTNLEKHIKSVRTLAREPAEQGQRFLSHLQSKPEVTIRDSANQSFSLRISNFRHLTVCAITLDPFTELAARGRHLRKFGVDIGPGPVWILSIDDLRVYADLMPNPLVFLHFVERRLDAAYSESVDLDDEMGHLGLYLEHNDYRRFAEEHKKESKTDRIYFDGFRIPIDDYYRRRLLNANAEVPAQSLPQGLKEVVDFLAKSPEPGRSEVSSALLDLRDLHSEIASILERQQETNIKLGRAIPYSTYGQRALTIVVWSPPLVRSAEWATNSTRAVMAATGERDRLLLELVYSTKRILIAAYWTHVGLDGLAEADFAFIQKKAMNVRRQRVMNILAERKIGPNDRCPCNSGKKYKRCCKRELS